MTDRRASLSKLYAQMLAYGEKGPSMSYDPWKARTPNTVPEALQADAIKAARRILANAGVKADVVLRTPKWQPGDVVIVRYDGPTSVPYTYVRGSKTWPGERFPKTDEQISALFAEGKVRPVLAHGGVPFDPSRLP